MQGERSSCCCVGSRGSEMAGTAAGTTVLGEAEGAFGRGGWWWWTRLDGARRSGRDGGNGGGAGGLGMNNDDGGSSSSTKKGADKRRCNRGLRVIKGTSERGLAPAGDKARPATAESSILDQAQGPDLT